jgi:hypothetical protein
MDRIGAYRINENGEIEPDLTDEAMSQRLGQGNQDKQNNQKEVNTDA